MPTTVSLDFETADYGADSACAIGMARLVGGEIKEVFYSLIRPPRPDIFFSYVHGLFWEDLQDAPSFSELWPKMSSFMNGADYLLAHNARFDRKVLYSCCQAAGITAPATPFLCTLKGSRKILKLPSHALNYLCSHLEIDLKHHNARSDAVAAARIFMHLKARGLEASSMLI